MIKVSLIFDEFLHHFEFPGNWCCTRFTRCSGAPIEAIAVCQPGRNAVHCHLSLRGKDSVSVIMHSVTSHLIIDRVRGFFSRQWILCLAFLLYLPLTFTGYGSDVDTFRVLEAGRNFIATADYVPSRRPGYLVYELSVFALDQLGGSWLTNLGSLFWALIAVASFLRICRRHAIPNANVLAAIFVVHPVFWYNATVTLDYVWALGMLLAGFDLLEQERFGWAGLAFGLAVGCRLSSLVIAALLLGYAWLRFPLLRRRLVPGAALAALLGGLAYVLPWDFVEWRSSFWKVSAGSPELWSAWLRLGRFAYKNLYFWGVPAGLLLVTLSFFFWRNAPWRKTRDAALLAGVCGLALLASEALFLSFPVEVEYLLPILPFFLLLVGAGLKSRRVLLVFLALVLSYNLVNFNIAHPDSPGQASSASIGLWVEPGYMAQEMRMRFALLGCDSHACYDERIQQRPGLPILDE